MGQSEAEESDDPEINRGGDGASLCLARSKTHIDSRMCHDSWGVLEALSPDIARLWVPSQEANMPKCSDGYQSGVEVMHKTVPGRYSFLWACEYYLFHLSHRAPRDRKVWSTWTSLFDQQLCSSHIRRCYHCSHEGESENRYIFSHIIDFFQIFNVVLFRPLKNMPRVWRRWRRSKRSGHLSSTFIMTSKKR
jgi:hypothetical protein